MNVKIMDDNFEDQTDFFNGKNFTFDITKEINIYVNKRGRKCINEFEVLEKISEGAVWKVKKVLRYFYDIDNVIKTVPYALKKTHIPTQKRRRYFKNECLNEIKIMGILNSGPNIIGKDNIAKLNEVIYSVDHPYMYLIMDYYELGNLMNRDSINFNPYHNAKLMTYLAQNSILKMEFKNEWKEVDAPYLLKKDSLPMDVKNSIAKILFKQILYALSYMHMYHIAHRDLKMENIMYSNVDNNIKLIDFSISSILNSNDELINEPGGTMHYQAPEHFSWNNKGYYNPFKADIWSFGICLYVFIFESFPFDAESEIELQIKISDQEVKYPFVVDQALEDLINQLLIKDPDKRLTDIQQILTHPYFLNEFS